MKTMVLNEIQPITAPPLKLTELSDSMSKPGEIGIKVACRAICRTDLYVIKDNLPRQTLPIIPGHQIIGRVDRIGAGCNRFQAS